MKFRDSKSNMKGSYVWWLVCVCDIAVLVWTVRGPEFRVWVMKNQIINIL